jgi:hypothetical protein
MQTVWFYESELRAIAQETLTWTAETGGNLFGVWEPEPVVALATRLNPHAERSATHCRFDLVALDALSRTLSADWGLSYFGDWHSHHRSGIRRPSLTDMARLGQIAERNQFSKMIEAITTRNALSPAFAENVLIDAYGYELPDWHAPERLVIGVIPGISPIREVLREQEAWRAGNVQDGELISCDRLPCLQLAPFAGDRLIESQRESFGRRLRQQLAQKLASELSATVEERLGPCGWILLFCQGPDRVALALGHEWPFPMLQVDRLGPGMDCSQPLGGNWEGLSARTPIRVLEICRAAFDGRLPTTPIGATGQPLITVPRVDPAAIPREGFLRNAGHQ